MVGGFSTIPAVQSDAPRHTSDRISLSIPVLIIIMLLLHLALAPQAAVAASPGANSISTKIRTSTHALQKFGYRRSQSLLRELHSLPTSTTINRLHRHILAKGGGASKSSSSADQEMRVLVGSSPPSCIKKCGKCTPCKSVLISIHTNYMPATPADYYPQAWRCQCKGKIYNP